MNWFTNNVIAAQSEKYKQDRFDEDGGCEHVEKDINLAYALRRENDSFGPVGSSVLCKACDDKADEEKGNETKVCCDCKQSVKVKDGIHWKWYDFYAPQGDTPLFVCKPCVLKEPHQNRIAQDNAAYNDEFGVEDDDEIETFCRTPNYGYRRN